MGSFKIKLLVCIFFASCTVEGSDEALVREKRFISLISDTAKIVSDGIQKQSDILHQGIESQKEIISKVPELVHQTSQAIKDTVIQAVEIPATVAANILISGANAYITASKKETISLPEINTSVLGFGKFVASGGKLKNLSTLTLNGSVNLGKSGQYLTIEVPVKLGDLSVEYENYSFKTWGINLSGSVKATIGKNAFLIKLELLGSADCTINVQSVEVQALEDIKIDLEGSFSSFLKSAVDYITTYLQGIIKTEVQKAIDQQMSSYVNKNSKLICYKFSQLNLS